jgi:hypothetical protein
LLSEDNEDIIKLSKSVTDNIIFQTKISNTKCKHEYEIRFIEWLFLDQNNNDLDLGYVGEVGEFEMPIQAYKKLESRQKYIEFQR